MDSDKKTINLKKVLIYRVFNCRVHNEYSAPIISLKILMERSLINASMYIDFDSHQELMIKLAKSNMNEHAKSVIDWFNQYSHTLEYKDGGLDFLGYVMDCAENGVNYNPNAHMHPYLLSKCVPKGTVNDLDDSIELIFLITNGLHEFATRSVSNNFLK